MSQWLVLDIGNTHTVAGLYDVGHPGADFSPLLTAQVRYRTDAYATPDEYRTHITQLFGLEAFWGCIERVVISTVVPALETVVRQACTTAPCLFINSETRREFGLDLPHPSQLGADRLANVAGALTLGKGPFLIVDAGTATTFCLVDSRPSYIGGAIVPGLETGWKALQARAAKLFSVELTRPATSIGRDTETQLQSGVILGHEAVIEGMADRLLADAARLPGGKFKEPMLLATGGCARLLKLSDRFRIEPELTLTGLLRYGQLTL